MSVKALKEYTLRAKYARYNKEAKRRETYQEANNRVRNMMLDLYPQVTSDINWAYDLVEMERILGSQRALQFGGVPALRHNARVYNCTSSYCDRLRFFQEAFYLLLCGCGTGFSVQKHHISKLPKFSKMGGPFYPGIKTFVIPDTIEGWSDALGVLLSSYFEDSIFPEYEGYYIEFDYSLIRPEGSYLSSGAGKAPGPEPLRRALEKIRNLLATCEALGREKLRPIDAYDIIMHASDAVLAGGVRRSATICVFSLDDLEMMKAKTGNWFIDNPQRGRSNNSVLLIRNQTTLEQFEEVMKHVREWGEPGFYWSDSTEQLPNPCFSPETRISTSNGLERIIDLYKKEGNNQVAIDNRAGKDDELDINCKGISLKQASPVKLTQTQADVYELITEHGHKLRVTKNHKFPTTRGRLELQHMIPGDVILLPSGESPFGSFGSYEEGLVLGLVTGDGTTCKDFAFMDVWEDDYDQLDYIKSIINNVARDMRSGSHHGDFEWINQAGNKKRIGGKRLYRFFTDVLDIKDPASMKDRVPECVFKGSREFIIGYLQGLFFTEGTVNLSGHKKVPTFSWRINQSNPELLGDVQILLGQFGIVSRLTPRRLASMREMPDGRGGSKTYYCKNNYELILSRPNAFLAYEIIGALGRKSEILSKMITYCGKSCRRPERYISKVKSIEFHSVSDVYCLTQPDTNTVIANGCVTGQCVEIGFWPSLMVEATAKSTHELLKNYKGPIGTDGAILGMVGNEYDHNGIGNNTLILSGWQFCNLTTINGQLCTTPDIFYEDCKGAAIIGTLQAGMTKFPYLGEVTEAIVRREALLGVSITGVMDSPKVLLNPDVLRKGAQIVLDTNERLAPLIGINPCARGTCLKPEGTTSCLLGTASGAGPWKFKKGFRRVQANRNEVVAQFFAEKNPWAVEKSKWCANGTTNVITFCLEAPEGAIIEGDMTAVEYLDVVKLLQENWVNPGKREERCTHSWLTHNVSNTVTVKPHEWDDVIKHIYDNRNSYAGISLLAATGDKDYCQAPFTSVYSIEEIEETYGHEVVRLVKPLIVTALDLYDNDMWVACDDILASKTEGNELKNRFVQSCIGFASRFMNGNIKNLTYILKDIHNLRQWNYLKSMYQNVDYNELIEDEDTTKPSEEISCAGGACTL